MPVAISAGQYHEPPRTTLRLCPAHVSAAAHGPFGSIPVHASPQSVKLRDDQSATHSHELPTMSRRPYTPAGREPTSHGRPVSGLLFSFFRPQLRPVASWMIARSHVTGSSPHG